LLDGPPSACPEVSQFLSTSTVSGPPANPKGGLVQAGDGSFFGTTVHGGNLSLNGGWGFGTAFRMTSGGALATLVSFGGTNGSCCVSSLVQGSDGNFYGTTASGGWGAAVSGSGMVFKMTSNGALTESKRIKKSWRTLFRFCACYASLKLCVVK
jgi:hypothetical protein